jgi:hypothetical protein
VRARSRPPSGRSGERVTAWQPPNTSTGPWRPLHGALLGAVVATYLAAYLFTAGTSEHRARPLYEGVGPAPAYRWVTPPRAFAASNVRPHPINQSIHLGPNGSPQVGVVSGDSQLVLNLPAGAIPPSPGETAASVSIKPLDPARLGLPPAGLFADGNAYLVGIKYQTSGRPIAELAAAADAVLTAPAPALTILFSLDGTGWQRLQTSQVGGGTTVAAPFRQPGSFLAAATVNVMGTASGGTAKHTSVVVLALLIGLAAALLILAPVLYVRSRRDDRA